MFINDILNKDDVCNIVIDELRKCGVKYRKEKKLKSNPGKKQRRQIFATPLYQLELTDVILVNGGVIVQVPKIVSDLCQVVLDNVSVEGIFRKAGSNVRQKEIKASLEAGCQLDPTYHAIDVANILKTFFRDLPESLLPPGNVQDTLVQCLMCGKRKVDALLMTCLLLPALSLNTLAFFMQFLHTVGLYSDTNKMTAQNLAIIFAPGLMPLTELTAYKLNNHVKIVQLLIENAMKIGELSDVLKKETESIIQRKVPEIRSRTQERDKPKKRRSGSLTRMLSGLRKIVSAIGPNEEVAADNHESTEASSMPCLSKSAKKRKILELQAFSAKKKKNVLAMQQFGSLLPFTPSSKTKKELRYDDKDLDKKSSEPPFKNSPQRRWSFVGTSSSWNRKKESVDVDPFTTPTRQKMLSPITSMPHINLDNLNVGPITPFKITTPMRRSDLFPQSGKKLFDDDDEPNLKRATDEKDYVKIPKAEYEAIKMRVSAIESRISQEFNNIELNSSNDSGIDGGGTNIPPNLENVQDKYEKALEKTETMDSEMQSKPGLKRLSRELKMMNENGCKIVRSPSARKIGTIRRRSREINSRLSRHASWNVNRNLIETPVCERRDSIVRKSSPDLSKMNLKRGRPNTLNTGLRHPSPVKKVSQIDIILDGGDEVPPPPLTAPPTDKSMEWVSATEFFSTLKSIEVDLVNELPTETPKKTGNDSASSSTMATPMLPPRLPPRRATPASVLKSSQKSAHKITNKYSYIVSPDNTSGRASIARIRTLNAGQVMAKARLFDDLSSENTNDGTTHVPPIIKRRSGVVPSSALQEITVQPSPTRLSSTKKSSALHRQIQMNQLVKHHREKMLMSPTARKSPRNRKHSNAFRHVRSPMSPDIVRKMKSSCSVKHN